MNKIKMVTRLGDQEVVVGECSSAQARILSKKNHAQFVDGKLLVSIRPFHVDMAINSIAADDPDPNVSEAEVQRRLDWFRTLMGTGTLAQIPRGSELEHILSVYKGFEGVKHLYKLSPEEMTAMTPEVKRFHRIHAVGESGQLQALDPHFREPVTDEWAESLFVDDGRSRKMDDPGPTQTYGHREVPEEVWLETDDDDATLDYRDHVRVCKARFNFSGTSVSRGIHEYAA